MEKTNPHLDIKWTVEIGVHSAKVVEHALAMQLIKVSGELEILQRTRLRDLVQIERWALPANLQKMSRAELQKQIDTWITLRDITNDLMQEFQPTVDALKDMIWEPK